MVRERMEPESKLNWAHRVSMTTLWAATTRHHHTEETVETQDTYHILTLNPKGMGALGEKLNEHCSAAKNTRNDLTSEAEL